MYKNINNQLQEHFAYGGGTAEYLRKEIPGFPQYLSRFFLARSDIRRLQEANKISLLILKLRDLHDTLELRQNIAALELTRQIEYEKQTDHTTHTLYLFLLGIWIYDHIIDVRQAFDVHIPVNHPQNRIKMFVFHWIYASLLHDVGYLFFEESNRFALDFYDEMFSSEKIIKYIGVQDDEIVTVIQKIWSDFLKKEKPWKLNMDGKISPSEILSNLNDIHWISILNQFKGEDVKGLNLLLLEKDKKKKRLIQFAKLIAENGYKGSRIPKVDHAVAGGLMLMQYTSVWYWIYKKLEVDHQDIFKKLTENYKFSYPEDSFTKHIIPACRAVGYHNIHMLNDIESEAFPPIKLDEEPLLYLAILCDELQIWDRWPAGKENNLMWHKDFQILAEDIIADLDVSERTNLVISLKLIDIKKCNKIIRTLNSRLVGWENFIEINKNTTRED